MRKILSEKNLVVVLFVVVLVFFALAQEDTKKIERMYQNSGSSTSSLDETPRNGAETEAHKKTNDLSEAQAR
jgi:hypothetical protein